MILVAKDIHEYEYPESVIAIADPWKIAKGISKELKGKTIEHHSGLLEVSQLMYKRPDLVDVTKLSDRQVPYEKIFSDFGLFDLFGISTNKNGETIDIVWNSKEQRQFAPTGQFSPNNEASKEIGEKYHNYMVKVLREFVGWMKKYKGPIGRKEK